MIKNVGIHKSDICVCVCFGLHAQKKLGLVGKTFFYFFLYKEHAEH